MLTLNRAVTAGPSLVREDMAQLEVDERRGVMYGLVVPWDREANVADVVDDRLVRYLESFASGSCDRAVRAPDRLPLTYGHSNSFGDRLGVGARLEDHSDGLYGEFRLDRSRLEQASEALETSHRGLSVSFRPVFPRPGSERDGARVRRVSVILEHVAAVPFAAYDTARVLALRDGDEGAQLEEPTDAEVEAVTAEREAAEAAAEARRRSDAALAEAEAMLEQWRAAHS